MEYKYQYQKSRTLPPPLLNFLQFSQQIKHRTHPNNHYNQHQNSLNDKLYSQKNPLPNDGVLQFRANRIQYFDKEGNVINDNNSQNLKDIADFKVVPMFEIPTHEIQASPIDNQNNSIHFKQQKFIVRQSSIICNSSLIRIIFLFIIVYILYSGAIEHNAIQKQSGLLYSMEKDPLVIDHQTKKDVPEMQPIQSIEDQANQKEEIINQDSNDVIRLGVRLLSIQQVEDIREEFKENWLKMKNRIKPINKRN